MLESPNVRCAMKGLQCLFNLQWPHTWALVGFGEIEPLQIDYFLYSGNSGNDLQALCCAMIFTVYVCNIVQLSMIAEV